MPLARIALVSCLILFLEMLLIRWLGTEVRVFAYLQNGVLVASFLGLGLGARNAREEARLLPAVAALAAVAAFIRDPLGWGVGEALTQGLIALEDAGVWYSMWQQRGVEWLRTLKAGMVGYALMASLGLLFAAAYVFYPLGQWMGRWIDAHEKPIAAYTANIAGSLAGIALFDLLTVLRTPPWAWLAAAGAGLFVLALRAPSSDGRAARVAAAVLALAVPLLGVAREGGTTWSPYQKLSLKPLLLRHPKTGEAVACGERIEVNNVGFMTLVDLDPARMAAAPDLYPQDRIRTSHYVLPWEVVGRRGRVLILGAGAGNDVAAALRAGATDVHAVEIDPALVDLGRARHPEKPYASERVLVTIDDARAVMRRDGERYDLVWLGPLDAHTSPSAYTNIRLDHFVYTRESIADLKALLAPDGVVVLFFGAQGRRWIERRLAQLLEEAFGAAPLALSASAGSLCLGWGGVMLLAGAPGVVDELRRRVESDAALAGRVVRGAEEAPVEVTTDNWPYLYLESPSLPVYHLLVAGVCLALAFLLRRRLFKTGEEPHLAMVLMGAGFMLLEVSAVSRASLLFGTTWTVNAYVVGAIMAMILLANAVASRVRVAALGWPAAGLLASLVALAFVPAAAFAGLPGVLRVALGGAFLSLPVFFSGLVFVTLWAGAERKDLALGSNLFGSLLGGLLGMLSMLLGFQALTLLTLAIYLGVLMLVRRKPQ
jgi:SAM-dependent methyltransferase